MVRGEEKTKRRRRRGEDEEEKTKRRREGSLRSESGREGLGDFGTVAIVIPRKFSFFLPVKCIIILIIIIITKIS